MDDIAARVLRAEVRAGARLIRWLEDGDARAYPALREIYPHTGNAHLIGITGPPGAGKSTLVDVLIAEQRRRGRRVGVVAIDPSSSFSGGAILGDRIRMQKHAADEGVFIRSMGTRGALGGLARAAFDAVLVLDAMRYDVILIETVGVGQDEIDIARLAHTTVIVAVPGLGDEIQAIKAGLLEIGEIFVVNKADRDGAHDIVRELELLLHLRESAAADGPAPWRAPLLSAVANRGEGAEAIVDAFDAHAAQLRAAGRFAKQFEQRGRVQLDELLREVLMQRLHAHLQTVPVAVQLLDAVRARQIDPYSAATSIAAALRLETDFSKEIPT